MNQNSEDFVPLSPSDSPPINRPASTCLSDKPDPRLALFNGKLSLQRQNARRNLRASADQARRGNIVPRTLSGSTRSLLTTKAGEATGDSEANERHHHGGWFRNDAEVGANDRAQVALELVVV